MAQNGKPLLIEDVSKDPRFSSSIADDKSGFKTRSILCVPMIMHDEVIGVMEVLNKKESAPGGKFTSDDTDILGSLSGFAAVSIANSKLNSDQKNFFANIIEILIASIETRSKNSPGHCWRVAQTACAIARRLKVGGQPYKNIYYAALLHDIGYVGAQKQMMEKKGFVSHERIELVHPVTGAEMVSTIHLLEDCAPLIRAHHEYWDGTGFPDGLQGESIPLGARIISFAEAMEDLRDSLADEDLERSVMRTRLEQYASENIDKIFAPQIVAAYLVEVSPAMGAPG